MGALLGTEISWGMALAITTAICVLIIRDPRVRRTIVAFAISVILVRGMIEYHVEAWEIARRTIAVLIATVGG